MRLVARGSLELENNAVSVGSITWIPPKEGKHNYISRGEWDPAEDRFIASFILEKGKKWSEISKRLQNQRTEHMVKNR